MKRLIIGVAALLTSVLPTMAAEVAYNQPLVNQVVTSTTPFTLDLNAYGVDAISFQVTAASATPATKTFSDGKQSTGTITVTTVGALSAQSSSDTITVINNGGLVAAAGTNSITISSNGTTGILSGSTLTVVGFPLYPGTHWTIGASSNSTASSIASAINQYVPNVLAALTTPTGGAVTLTCRQTGVFCNSYRITTSTTAIVFSTSGVSNLMTGGADNASINVNGIVLYQGDAWAKQDTSSNTAISIATAIDNLVAYTASTNSTTGVIIKVVPVGSYANAYTLTTSTDALRAKAATFKEGQDNAYLSVNGTILTQGSQWTAGVTSALTAASIGTALNTAFPGLITSTAPTGTSVVFSTGIISLTSNNYSWTSSTSAALSVSNTGLFGGSVASYVLNGTSLAITSHGYATGEALLLTTGTISITNLTNQTTYFAIAVNANTIGLATTNAGALAGTAIVLASTSTTGAHTFTLAPLALAGVMPFTWSVSNDGVTFSTPTVTATNVTIPINYLATPWSAIYGYDFGNINYRYLRLTVSGPSTAGSGGLNTVVTGYGKRYWR